jgi:ribulose 1,5-bisphosphate synthetase/thiazole synthase
MKMLLGATITATSASALLLEAPLLNQTYDYVIVGGGTSGLTVADRLTENGKRTFPPPFPISSPNT